MSLTSAQLTTLKADLLAATDQEVIDALAVRNTTLLAELYNAASSPAFIVWRTSLSSEQARAAIIGDSAGLAQLDNLTAGKRDSLLWVFGGNTNPASAGQRTAISDLCGTQNALKAAIAAGQKRTATRGEKLFATGTGSDASPGTLVFEGSISFNDISEALR